MLPKKDIGIVTDEGADLPEIFARENEIEIVPFKMELDGMENFSGNIYQKIRQAEQKGIKSLIKSSQPSIGDFLSAFKKSLERFEKIICITLTSKHSGTFNSALQARNFLDEKTRGKIFITDSLSFSCGQGLLVLKALDLAKEGLSVQDISEELKKMALKINIIFVLDEPKWAVSSGRIPGFVAAWLKKAQEAGIRPILGLKNGKIKAVGIKKGVKEITLALFKDFELKVAKNKQTVAAITHADNPEAAERLKKMVQTLGKTKVVFINMVGSVLGGYAGPGALALAWHQN